MAEAPVVEKAPYTLAAAITETIAEKETGGDCTQEGQSGERGCYQYMPSTWVSYSTEVLGYVADQTPENEHIVTQGIVSKLLADGYTAAEIFLVWNSGQREKCSAGVNKYGVRYDSCEYVRDALEILAEKRAST